MADPSITIKQEPRPKSFARIAAGSLAQRVLLMSMVLLGLPLLIHTLFLYHREYRENLSDAFLTMRSLGESRALYIEQLIRNQETILQAAADGLPETDGLKKEYLFQKAKEYGLEALFYVPFDAEGKPVCEDLFCPDPTVLPLTGQKNFALIHPLADEKDQKFYIGRMVFSRNIPKGALVTVLPAAHFLNRLSVQEYSPYPLKISIVDETGGTDAPGIFRRIPAADQPDSWILKSSGGDFLAVQHSIANTAYSIFLTTPEKSIAHLQRMDYFFRIASLLFFVCFLGGSVLVWLTCRVSRPLQSLCSVMQRVTEGGVHARFREDRVGFEINVLGRQMNQMLDAMLAHQKEAEQERIARERLAEELKIGRRIQAGMLPSDLPDVASLEMAPGYLAAREVSGDFYDMMPLDDGRLLIAMGDAADKGISACLYSLGFRSMLRMAASVEQDLARIVSVSNDLFMRDAAASSFFITAWIGLYDPRSGELSYCSQGHPPAYVRTPTGQVIELSAEGMALGLEKINPLIAQFVLHEQDLLFLYTDGVIEATDADGQFFGKERLKEFLARCKKSRPQLIVDQLIDEIHLFSAGSLQSDDLTLLAIRVKHSSIAKKIE